MSAYPMAELLPRRIDLLVSLVALVALTACSGGGSFSLAASAPWSYSADVDPGFQRVAILVTIANQSGSDQAVNPANFLVRDANQRIYPSDPAATFADEHLVRLASAHERGVQDISPLPTVTLRQNDVLSGFVVFEIPANAHLVELVWRQSDTDSVISLPAAG